MIREAQPVLYKTQVPNTFAIWYMMETSRSMLHTEEIANASSKIHTIIMRASDFAKDSRALHTRSCMSFLTNLSLSIIVA